MAGKKAKSDGHIRTSLTSAKRPASRAAFRRVSALIPGGVSGTGFMHPYPSYIQRADGPYLWDVDGNRPGGLYERLLRSCLWATTSPRYAGPSPAR